MRKREVYLDSPFHQVLLVGLDERRNGDTNLIAPRIPLLDMYIGREPRILDSLLRFRALLWFPTRILFPVTAVFREERLEYKGQVIRWLRMEEIVNKAHFNG